MHKLHELKEMLCEELEEYASKGKLDVGGLDIVDKLAHAVKNLDKIIEVDSGYSNRYPYYRGGSYTYRDSRGRYSRAEADMDGMLNELRGMMPDLPEDKKAEVKRFVEKIERM